MRNQILILTVAVLVGLAMSKDLHDDATYANLDCVHTTHLDLFLNLDFNKKMMIGTNTLTMEVQHDGVDQVILDTRGLDIRRVIDQDGIELQFSVSTPNVNHGSALAIKLNTLGKKGQ